MKKLEIIYKKVDDIIPYENNPRNNEKSIDNVANSIKQFGFKVPIVIDKNNVIVAGHTRLKASEKLGLKEVPCIIADDLTEQEINAYRLADNKVGEASFWNEDLLNLEMENLLDFNMADFGFDLGEYNEEIERNDLSNNVFEKYEIIITCENELDLQKKYDKLVKEGYDCRISTL